MLRSSDCNIQNYGSTDYVSISISNESISNGNISDLSEELIYEILSYCDLKEFFSFILTSKDFYKLFAEFLDSIYAKTPISSAPHPFFTWYAKNYKSLDGFLSLGGASSIIFSSAIATFASIMQNADNQNENDTYKAASLCAAFSLAGSSCLLAVPIVVGIYKKIEFRNLTERIYNNICTNNSFVKHFTTASITTFAGSMTGFSVSLLTFLISAGSTTLAHKMNLLPNDNLDLIGKIFTNTSATTPTIGGLTGLFSYGLFANHGNFLEISRKATQPEKDIEHRAEKLEKKLKKFLPK